MPADRHQPLRTVPGVQEWTVREGGFRLTAEARILTGPETHAEATLLAGELAELTGRRPEVVTGSGAPASASVLAPAAGDIRLEVDPAAETRTPEGYTLDLGGTATIRAAAPVGVFRGTRTLLQLLRTATRHTPAAPTVPAGHATDWPLKPYRGLMVDCGRKYFTPAWFHRLIKTMAYTQLNVLHLHLSDNPGFRIASDSHPEIVSADGHLTKQQLRELIEHAAAHHIEVVPELDVPGHMRQVTEAHPELALPGHPHTLDLANPATYRLIQDLLEEYLPLFPGRWWMIGGDEAADVRADPRYLAYAREHYLPEGADPAAATGNDTVFGFLNWANDIVRAHGKTMRMWNDGLNGIEDALVQPSRQIHIEQWSGLGPRPNRLLDLGFRLVNSGSPPTYYTLGAPGHRKDDAWAYEHWEADEILRWDDGGYGWGLRHWEHVPYAANDGAVAHIWTDAADTETPEHIAEHSARLVHLVARAGWGAPRVAPDYPAFARLLAATGPAPGGGLPVADLALDRPVSATGGSGAALAVDDDPSTGWLSGPVSPGRTGLTVDLGGPHRVERVVVQWGSEYAAAYRLEVDPGDDDGAGDGGWRPLALTTGGRGGLQPYRSAVEPGADLTEFDPREAGAEEFEQLDAVARRLRLVVDEAAPGVLEGVRVVALRIFGRPTRR